MGDTKETVSSREYRTDTHMSSQIQGKNFQGLYKVQTEFSRTDWGKWT